MSFTLKYIDHVAIRVSNMQASAAWYQRVLGLRKADFPAWGEYPIFMMAGSFGVALFPSTLSDPVMPPDSRNLKIDHFAFHVSAEDFVAAQAYFKEIDESFIFQDHTYFHSIYLRDPDQHTVELTTAISRKTT